MQHIKQLVFNYKWKITGIALGTFAGFAYWYFIGCTSGTCPIQSNWESSTLYGGLIGFVLANGPRKQKVNKEKPEDNTLTHREEK
ncbi:MAG TPA: DUF6132 family protein [Prolixibacteraceae bacterium]|nr:DUF6132 family protein [Prolixibacteraceae bacterium]